MKEYLKMEDNEVYILMAVARKKFNPLSRSTEIVWRETIRSPEQYERKYNKLVSMIKARPEMKFYLYLTINPRDCMRALYSTAKRLIDYAKEPNERIKKIDAVWLSELMKDQNKSKRTKRWLLDLDTKDLDTRQKLVLDLKQITKIELIRETKNGCHIVFAPCDMRRIVLPENCELKRDALLFIESFNFDKCSCGGKLSESEDKGILVCEDCGNRIKV